MESISCPVHTIIFWLAASMGIVIAASGKKGERSVYPLSRIMLHQVSGGYSGTIQDSKIKLQRNGDIKRYGFEHLSKMLLLNQVMKSKILVNETVGIVQKK